MMNIYFKSKNIAIVMLAVLTLSIGFLDAPAFAVEDNSNSIAEKDIRDVISSTMKL